MCSREQVSPSAKPGKFPPTAERRGDASGRPMPGKRFLYRIYGLIVVSEFELPELVPVEEGKPNVQIRFGDIPPSLNNPIVDWKWCSASNSEYVLFKHGVANYHVANGKLITIDRRLGLEKSPPAADLRLWLLGSVFGALLHQRGLLPLHVSAVQTPNGVWAFTGESGEGKSTLAGFLIKRFGYELVSDDVSVIDPQDREPIIYPGPRKLKLWPDALSRFGFEGSKKTRDLSNSEKFQIYLDGEGRYRPQPLHAVVLLETSQDDSAPALEVLGGIEAFTAMARTVYRPHMAEWFKLPEQPLRHLSDLCRRIRVFRFRRPRCLESFEENLKPLTDHMSGGKS